MDSRTVLSLSPHIVENIFQNLSARELCRCACVCKMWNYFALVELNSRKRIVHFIQEQKCTEHKKTRATLKDCSLRRDHSFEKEFFEMLGNLKIKPAICIAFATSAFWENFEELFPSHRTSKPQKKKFRKMYDDDSRQKYLESVIKTAFKNNLPSHCQVSLYIGASIVSSHKDSETVKILKSPAVCGYFFPDLSNEELILCKRREYGRDLVRTIRSVRNTTTLLALVDHKCLINFAITLQELKGIFNAFQNGVVIPIQVGSSNIPVFFAPNVETSCFCIGKLQDCESRFKQLDQRGFFRKQTISFMFAEEFGSFLQVCKEFQKMYPQIPIAGLSGKAVIESDSSNETKYIESKLTRLTSDFYRFNYCSKCILISFKAFDAI